MPGLLARVASAAEAAKQNDQVLLVVELAGGNDGLNTVSRSRTRSIIASGRHWRLIRRRSSSSPIRSASIPRWSRWQSCSTTVNWPMVQGVGYPQPDRSHFRSMEIWHTASTEAKPPAAGWLGVSRSAPENPRPSGRWPAWHLPTHCPRRCRRNRPWRRCWLRSRSSTGGDAGADARSSDARASWYGAGDRKCRPGGFPPRAGGEHVS